MNRDQDTTIMPPPTERAGITGNGKVQGKSHVLRLLDHMWRDAVCALFTGGDD